MEWYQYPVAVPYGNKNYDIGLGGSHDLTLATPLGTPITALQSGQVTDISSPSWGKQVCIKLDAPWRGAVQYMAYLHLGSVHPLLLVGSRVHPGDLLGYSGGATSGSYSTPFGAGFLNSIEMSSQPQIGVALMRGPVYGTGAGWDPLSADLDPTEMVKAGPACNFGPDDLRIWSMLFHSNSDLSWGIPRSWLSARRKGYHFGPPLENEVSINRAGVIHHEQQCSGALASWNSQTGEVVWYGPNGPIKIV